MSKQQIGVVGMAVMGRNLALNIESRGYTVSVFNRSREKTEEVIAENPGKKLVPYYTVQEFVESLETPRRILLMVKAGAGTDSAIDSLKPYLDKGDIIIDGGNTFFQDTIRRNRELSAEGFNFIGTGVSGGEEGALKGPSIMPGGQKEAYELVAPILKQIAAVAEDGEPCVTYIGADGAGHYVKMVHNGIEYGDMQLIAEAYALLKGGLALSNEELAQTFTEWNEGELSSYLIDITKDIFTKKDEEGKYLVDVILDEAANKGTGKWTSQSSLDLGEPLSLITESVFARYISSLKDQRVAASKVLSGPQAQPAGDKAEFIEKCVARCTSVKSSPMLRASPSCVLLLMNTTGILTTARSLRFSVLAASFVRSSCKRSLMLMRKTLALLTFCWRHTSNRSLMTISKRCVMWWLMPCRMVFRYRRSLPQLPTTTVTVPQFCQLT